METFLVKVIQSIAFKLLTEKFFSAMLIIGLKKLAEKTDTAADDKMVRELAEALGRSDLVE